MALENQKMEGEVPLERFERLGSYLTSKTGLVHTRLEFRKSRKQSTLIVGNASVEVGLVCQNCLQNMSYGLSASIRHRLVGTEEALLELDPEEDGIVCSEDDIALTDILEDELIVSLPMVSRHPEGDCEAPVALDALAAEPEPAEDSATYKPFAGLAALKDEITRS